MLPPCRLTSLSILFLYFLIRTRFSQAISESTFSDAYLDIHVRLSSSAESDISRLNAALTSDLKSAGISQLINFDLDVPHVTLYLTEFTEESLTPSPEGSTPLLLAIMKALESVTALGGSCRCPSVLSSNVIGFVPDMVASSPWINIGRTGTTSGSIAMLDAVAKCDDFDGAFVDAISFVEGNGWKQVRPSNIGSRGISKCLKSLSDAVVNFTSQYITEEARTAFPPWVLSLPEGAEKRGRLESIQNYGSPNVYQFFHPHVSLAAVREEDAEELASVADEEFYAQHRTHSKIEGVGVGAIDNLNLGTVFREGSVEFFPFNVNKGHLSVIK